MAMRLRAPIIFLQTLFIITETKISQFSQYVKATLGLSVYSRHIPTVTKIGGMIGGMKRLMFAEIFSNGNQEV
ncbi:hypothetical protein DVG78_01875 [Runella aurantiaca]|uniref:Uncharacterized protein n=1 Tax=Runella aurantiaca TaxID=2282308 RepID=A0A369IMF9_9BACT|nr:hypothetical protein DVG78_01875 [Runella aurantiaca]